MKLNNTNKQEKLDENQENKNAQLINYEKKCIELIGELPDNINYKFKVSAMHWPHEVVLKKNQSQKGNMIITIVENEATSFDASQTKATEIEERKKMVVEVDDGNKLSITRKLHGKDTQVEVEHKELYDFINEIKSESEKAKREPTAALILPSWPSFKLPVKSVNPFNVKSAEHIVIESVESDKPDKEGSRVYEV